jgi:hypothetical protein
VSLRTSTACYTHCALELHSREPWSAWAAVFVMAFPGAAALATTAPSPRPRARTPSRPALEGGEFVDVSTGFPSSAHVLSDPTGCRRRRRSYEAYKHALRRGDRGARNPSTRRPPFFFQIIREYEIHLHSTKRSSPCPPRVFAQAG